MKKILFAATSLAGVLLIGSSLAYADSSTNAIVEYQSGGIVFDGGASLPSNLNFGALEIQSQVADNRIATANGEEGETPSTGSLTISDNRGDVTAGWNVKLRQQTQFVATGSTSEPLDGATLTIHSNQIDNNLDADGITGEFAASGSTNETVLMPEQTHTVLSAESGAGMGETLVEMTQFELSVPENTKKIASNYQTTLSWTVSSTPENQ